MTSNQIRLVQNTFALLELQEALVATTFFNRLFAMNPSLRVKFPRDLTEHKRKLMKALKLIIGNLNRPFVLLPALEQLGRKHALKGVRGSHYEAVGAALLQTLKYLGKTFYTPQVESAWAAIYAYITNTMQRTVSLFNLQTAPTVPYVI